MDSTVKVFLSILLTFNFNHKSDSSVSKSLTKNGLLDTMNSSKANSVVKKVYPQVETVVGSSVELPCNTSSPTDDSVQLILWFKSAYGTGPPFLKLDARSSNSLETASITLASEYENRIYFNLSSSPSILNINPVREEDASIYSCRVDYKWSRTSISNINLFIIVPPNDVIISDPQSGLRLGQIAGPYPEDSQLKLNCIAIGGKPAPQLVWYLDNQLIDDSYHFNNETFQVVNELVIDKLKRSHPDSVLTCKATNHITIPRISASTRLELYLRPLQVNIYPKKPLKAGQKAELTCESKGAKPSTKLTWFINGRELKEARSIDSVDEETTSSLVSFTPMPSHNGLPLICRAENPKIINSSLFDNWFLQVYCIAIENSTLTINISSTSQAGSYECLAKNSEGTGKSNPIDLKVHYEPTCTELDSKVIYEVPMGETVNISCNIDPRVTNATIFWWKFLASHLESESSAIKSQSTLTSTSISPVKQFTRNKVIQYKVNSSSDYGLLICGLDKGLNVKQPNQCQFQVKPSTALPYPPENCHLRENSSDSSYLIECSKPSKSSPWKETYFLEIHDQDNLPSQPSSQLSLSSLSSSSSPLSSPIVRVNDEQPYFKIAISELPSNESTNFVIYSQNGVGKSSQVFLSIASHKMLQSKATNPELNHLYKSFLFPCIGLLSFLGLIGISIYAFNSKRRKSIVPRDDDSKASPNLSRKSNKISPKSSNIRTPDVIPLRINDSVNEAITYDEKWSKEEMLDKNETVLATQLDNYSQHGYPDYSASNIHVQLITHPIDDNILDQDKMTNKSDDCLNDGQFIPVLIQFQEHQHILKDTSNPISLMETRLPMNSDIQPYSMSTPV
ncbi:uncharacterized protein LOC107363174 isoform X2 [Tetranychus urticae]|uniref:uncharacterized protein LOC107363174 isoform X2 n=1 Tax=Tetranychus urticae TaxID=32264 RepID=UPI00077BB474|nr:uncharacterized protein LOC107363174 isoform X2 [Tetranychus urticae]